MINPILVKNKNFSFIIYIIIFFNKNNNKQYNDKLDISKIIQSNKEINEIINKVSK